MTLDRLLQQLKAQGIKLGLNADGELKIRAGKGVVDETLLAALKANRSELIGWLQQGQPISHRPLPQQLALTPQQLRLWLACQRDEPSLYHLPAALLIHGKLDVAKLQQASNCLLQAHPILTSIFIEQHGQVVMQPGPAAFTLEQQSCDLSANNGTALARLCESWLRQPFMLDKGPLFRTRLLQLQGEDSYLLLLNIHHLITDGISNQLLLQQWLAAYQGEALPVENVNYYDYARWLDAQQHQSGYQQKRDFWQQALTGCEALQLLPPSGQPVPHKHLEIALEDDDYLAIEQLARRYGISIFSVYFTAFSLLLHKLSGRRRFAIASPSANRQRAELQSCVGFLANTLSLVANLEDELSLADLLQRNHQQIQLANQYADVPFADILEHIGCYQQAEADALLEAGLVYREAAEQSAFQLPGLTVTPLPPVLETAKFPLTLEVEHGKPLRLEYRQGLNDAIATEFADYLRHCLQALLQQAQMKLAAFHLLDHNEQLSLLGMLEPAADKPVLNAIYQSNQTQTALPGVRLHQLVETQVEKTPQAIAVSDDRQRLSYRQLNQLANQLAQHIYQAVGSSQVVAFNLPRSVWLSVAVLAISKSGNTSLPLEPGLPAQRKALLLKDADAALLLNHEADDTDISQLAVNAHSALWQATAQGNLNIDSDALFSLIYTSGSTGQPKGVELGHAGMVNRLLWMQQAFPLTAADVVLQKTPVSFDVSVWELFWPLLAGARLHVAKPEGHRDSSYLADIIQREQVTTLHFVPSMLDVFLHYAPVSQCQSLRQVFCSGEALAARQVQAFYRGFGNALLVNLYGPTEASIDVSVHGCKPGETGPEPIGRPISNTRLHLLDDKLRPVPPGVTGEIHIAGAGLAEGYHQLPEKTAQSFIDNPWYLEGHPYARLYRSGDLGSYNSQGELLYHGRIDQQVKLRGQRLELGEVEALALQCSGVNQAAALISTDQQQLLLFYTGGAKGESMRQHLQQQLPAGLLPNRIEQRQALPLTVSGKLDRTALLTTISNAVLPATAEPGTLLSRLQNIWQQQLRQPVNVEDDFFELGGHSLLAMRIIAEASSAFDVELQFADIFHYPTVTAMAGYIGQLQQDNKQPLQPVPRSGPLPRSSQQQQLLAFQQLQPQSTAYLMPAAFRLHGSLHIHALQQAFIALIERHEILHTCYPNISEQKVLAQSEWRKRWQLIVEECPEQDVQLLAESVSQQPFNLFAELPIRAALYQLAEQDYLLVIVLHHIAADAWTLELLADELAQLYRKQLQLPAAPLPPPVFHYADFSHWQQQQDNSTAEAYWLEQLCGVPEYLNLPHDRPRPQRQSYAGRQRVAELPAELSERIHSFCRQQQVSPFMLLLSSYQLLLAKLAHQQDIAVAVPFAGRDRHEWQSIAGCFINTCVLRMQLQHNPNVSELLQLQKTTVLDAIAHQQLPLEKLLPKLAAAQGFSREPAYTPVVQVGFNFLQLQQQPAAWPELEIEPVHQPLATAKTDMSWQFYQHAQGLRLVVEYNPQLFNPGTIQHWQSYLLNLLEQMLQQPQGRVLNFSLLTPTEERQWLVQQFGRQFADFYPLTAMQRDIYLDSVIDSSNRQNYIGFVTHSTSELDEKLWQQVVEELYRHYPALRSCIVESANGAMAFAYQLVLPLDEPMPQSCFHFVDHGTQAFTNDVKQSLVEEQLYSPYDFHQPLWRVRLHRFAGNHHLLVLSVHHAMFDGVSMQLFGRLMKGNYEKHLHGEAPDLPADAFTAFVVHNREQMDSPTAYHYWQKQSKHIQPLLDFSVVTDAEPQLLDLYHSFSANAWQQIRDYCKAQRTTPAIYFKALFALVCKYQHGISADMLFAEVVSGRNRDNLTSLGLFFEQQPNLLPASVSSADNTFSDLLKHFARQRKTLAEVTPVSLGLQRKLLPQQIPYLFNFYIMESATGFKGGEERIEHLMPQMDHAVNFICKIIDNQLSLQLSFNRRQLPGEHFMQQLLQVHERLQQGKTCLAELFEHDSHSKLVDCFGQPAADGIAAYRKDNAATLLFVRDGEVKLLTQRQPQQTVVEAKKMMLPPQNELEALLLTIWQQVLGTNTISTDDNFFALGGHSLQALAIANRVQDQLQLSLPLDKLFTEPTITGIARLLVEHPQALQTQLPPLIKAEQADSYPLSAAQKRLYLLSQIPAMNRAYQIPLALKLSGPLQFEVLQQAVNVLLQRHPILASDIREDDKTPRLYLNHTELAIPVEPCAESEWQTQMASQPALQPGKGRLGTVQLLAANANSHLLLINLHHLIADGRSLLIIARELGLLYQAISRGENYQYLLPQSVQYQDYSLWQQQLPQALLDEQLAYWQQTLAGAPLNTGLPYDYPITATPAFTAGQLHFAISAVQRRQLMAIAGRNGVSLFMLLLTLYQLLLARACKQPDICVGIPRDGRFSQQLENTVGFLVNALVIRTDLSVNYTFDELLAAVRNQCLAAFAHELVPVEDVMQALNLPHQLEQMPIVQAAFNLLPVAAIKELQDGLQLGELQIEAVNIELPTAKLDLLLNIHDTGESLYGVFEYNRERFAPSSVQALLADYQQLLEALLHDSSQHIHALADESTPAQIYADWPQSLDYYRKQLADMPAQGFAGIASGDGQQAYRCEFSAAQWNELQQACIQQNVTSDDYLAALYALLLSFYCDSESIILESRQQLMLCEKAFTAPLIHCLKTAGKTAWQLAQTLAEQRIQQQKYPVSEGVVNRLLADKGLRCVFKREGGDVALQLHPLPDAMQLQLHVTAAHFNGEHLLPRLLQLHAQQMNGGEPSYLLANEAPFWLGRGNVNNEDFLAAINRNIQQQPDKPAVRSEDKTFSYRELGQAVNCIACALQQQGVPAAARVAVCMPQQPELIAALLAIAKLGCCYIPVDPGQPTERLRYLLEDCEPALVLADNETCNPLQALLPELPLLDITAIEPVAETVETITPTDNTLLYAIYTSGSTGLPKAAQVYRHSFSRLLHWYIAEYQMDADDAVLVMSATGFDLTQKNLFAALMAGGTVVLAHRPVFEPVALLSQIQHNQITLLNCAPSAFYPLLEQADNQQLQSLCWVLLGGEAINIGKLRPWQHKLKARFANMYGPTECTDIALAGSFNVQGAEEIPLGQPIPELGLYLLNSQGLPVGENMLGEICLSGPSLGQGYWQQPQLTGQAFTATPCNDDEAHNRLYRTGDFAYCRYLNGEPHFYYAGRRDQQLKRHGVRIAAREIEQALNSLPQVSDSKVLLHDERLMAYVISDGELSQWRQQLQAKLPASHIPQALITLAEWPLNNSGKLDIQALLALPESRTSGTLPATELEQELHSLWQQVLGHAQIGVDDNFFELGGDSLAAVTLVHRIEKHYQLQLPVSAFFHAQSIRQLARVIGRQQSNWTPLVPIQPEGNNTPLFALHGIGGLVFHYQPLAQQLGKQQPVYGLQAFGLEAEQTPFTNMDEMLELYLSAIKQQQPQGPYQLVGHSFGGILALELARRLLQQGEPVSYLGLIDTHLPNRYFTGKLTEAELLQLLVEHSFGKTDLPFKQLLKQPRDRMLQTLQQALDDRVDATFIERALAMVQGLQQMMQGYKPEPLTIPVHLLRAEDELKGIKGLAGKLWYRDKQVTLGWDQLVDELAVDRVEGDHDSMMVAEALADAIQSKLLS